MPMPYGFEHDMKNHSENSLMAIYVQTVSSYIFKNILFEVYKHQEEQRDFRIMLPIHDAIMIECNTKSVRACSTINGSECQSLVWRKLCSYYN